jgi:hypothetical protein
MGVKLGHAVFVIRIFGRRQGGCVRLVRHIFLGRGSEATQRFRHLAQRMVAPTQHFRASSAAEMQASVIRSMEFDPEINLIGRIIVLGDPFLLLARGRSFSQRPDRADLFLMSGGTGRRGSPSSNRLTPVRVGPCAP